MGEAAEAVFREAVSDDLAMFTRLHDRELDTEIAVALKASRFPEGLGLRLTRDDSAAALAAMAKAVAEFPDEPDPAWMAEMAADYADVYLTHGCRATPAESPWLDPDRLVRQEPMFKVREWYRRHGLAMADWRNRSDDHLVPELQFVTHLIASGEEGSLVEAARFLDSHPLNWVGSFAKVVDKHCRTPFYAALAVLTADYLEELRDILTSLAGVPRPVPAEPAVMACASKKKGQAPKCAAAHA
ncbi:MAG: molecular chaperone TorD family protein [Alphaproteobacteria bacterium]|nr:molecular chaperone TorD family protein [Alphaproteobacteria bacterium]MBF0391442.1 molecular chaperone TorD family protein [Alphaproteobacteria bacterium]